MVLCTSLFYSYLNIHTPSEVQNTSLISNYIHIPGDKLLVVALTLKFSKYKQVLSENSCTDTDFQYGIRASRSYISQITPQ